MKFLKNICCVSGLLLLFLAGSCKKNKQTATVVPNDPPGSPPKTWQEHWGGPHTFLLNRVYFDSDVAVYYDPSMDRTVTWPFKTMSDTWKYVKKTYGTFGDSARLYVVLHGINTPFEEVLGGGHPATYFDESHDYRNAIDVGLSDWTYPTAEQILIPIHETGHIVNLANNGVHGSPSDVIWGDSKFMEIYNYDVLMNIGRQDEAARVYDQLKAQVDTFPRAGSQWFKNWFYPIYSKYGHAAVLSKYFKLLAANYPKVPNPHGAEYTQNLNWGEFVHFWSGATGDNMKAQATLAFGWPDEWEQQFRQAQKDFPNVKYTY